jgi:uncharacterized protein YbjT (DUF2867 family)
MIAITGATGQTGSKIANLLLDKGKKIRVVGRSGDKLSSLKDRGAELAVGDQGDVDFLTRTFSGCEAVYLLIPPKMDIADLRVHYNTMGDIAVEAIRKSGVKKIVFLSSLGAELAAGTGPVVGLHDVEAKLGKLTQVDVIILRPGYFMENLLRNVSLIKNQHINGNTTPPDAPVAMIATRDIAMKAAELLATPLFSGHTVIDLFGDRISYKEATKHIGTVIGFPELPYVQFSDADAIKGMAGMGMSENLARLFVELSSSIGKGLVHPTQIDPLKPNTSTSFKTFAKEVLGPVFKNAA